VTVAPGAEIVIVRKIVEIRPPSCLSSRGASAGTAAGSAIAWAPRAKRRTLLMESMLKDVWRARKAEAKVIEKEMKGWRMSRKKVFGTAARFGD